MPKISIVIPTYNRCDELLRPCLESIQNFTDLSDVEVVVSANGCTDNTREYVESLGKSFKLVWNDAPLGFARAVNAGIKEASGETIVLLNNDCVIDNYWEKTRWLNVLTAPLKDPKVGVAGTKKLICNDTKREFMIFFCVAFRKDILEVTGLLDESFGKGYGEDIDFCIKLQNVGYKMVEVGEWLDTDHRVSSFPLFHQSGATVHKLPDWEDVMAASKKILIDRYRSTKLSIVIPTYNHCDEFLKPCLESILKHTDLDGVEIIVSANGCKDNTKEYVESLGGPVKLLWSEAPLGYTKATNEGIKIAKGEYIMLLNNDTVILDQQKNTWINMLLQPFENPKVGITGPMKAYCPFAKRDFMIFFCVVTKRVMFDKIGLLDELFNPGFGEDTDFCIKLQDLGYEIVQIPDTKHTYSRPNFMVGGCPIYHKGEGTFANWPGGEKLLAERRFMLMNRYAKEIKLNLGSGDRPMPKYFNIDIDNKNSDLSWDVRTIPLDDNKVDEILAVHLFEHFKYQEIESVLKEWFRVLKPEGRLVLEFPDVEATFRQFLKGDLEEQKGLLHCIFGANTPQFPHLYGWYGGNCTAMLNKAGFTNVQQLQPQHQHWGINTRIEAMKGSNLPDGWFAGLDIKAYRELMSKVPVGGVVAELGCWKGRSICSVADIIKARKLQVTVVDTFQGSESETGHAEAKVVSIEKIFRENIKRFGLELNVLSMTTDEASLKFPDKHFDLVFIDADHTKDMCQKDIQHWYPKVKRGGTLAGHDCLWKSVAEALTAEFGHLALVDGFNVWWYNKPKVWDCFPFCNELDQLEIRLRELDEEVDYFVLVEGTETHSGKPKPLYFEENKARFEKWLPKIKHVVVSEWPEYVEGVSDSSWARERKQRDAIMEGLKDIGDYDVVISGDADEIVSAKALNTYRRHMGICKLEMSLYYYFLNYQSSDGDGKWNEARIFPIAELRRLKLVPSVIRYLAVSTLPQIKDAGWHFSFQGGTDEVIKKIQSWAHQEYNRPEIIDRERVERLIDEGKDVFGREQMTYKTVPMNGTFPKCVMENRELFKHMIREMPEVVNV